MFFLDDYDFKSKMDECNEFLWSMDLDSSMAVENSSQRSFSFFPQQQYESPHQPNQPSDSNFARSQFVVRLLEETSSKQNVAGGTRIVDPDDDGNGNCDIDEEGSKRKALVDGFESESYQAFDKLWVSSVFHGEPMLKIQRENLVRRLNKQEKEFQFDLSSNQVTIFFRICRKMKTSYAVRYRALELYSRYLQVFSERMSTFLSDCSKDEYEEFYKRFENQILLRMCTCVLLASKLHSDNQALIIRLETIEKFLKDNGYNHNITNIMRSEQRILETLDYRCHWAIPLDAIEQILALLFLTEKVFQRTQYFCVRLLEYSYSDWQKIRHKFQNRKKEYRNRFNVALMSAAIVAAALFIVAAEVKTTNLHKHVGQVAELPDGEIEDLAVLILDLLYGGGE